MREPDSRGCSHGNTSRRSGILRSGLGQGGSGGPATPPQTSPARRAGTLRGSRPAIDARPRAPARSPRPAVLTGSPRPRSGASPAAAPQPSAPRTAISPQARPRSPGRPQPLGSARGHPALPPPTPAARRPRRPTPPASGARFPAGRSALHRGRPAAESGPDRALPSMRSQPARRRLWESPLLRVFGAVGGQGGPANGRGGRGPRSGGWGLSSGGAETGGRRYSRLEVRAADVTFGLGRDGASPQVRTSGHQRSSVERFTTKVGCVEIVLELAGRLRKPLQE